MILLLDNYDSFVHNLARYFRRLGCETVVVRSDEIDVDRCRQLEPGAIVISPGPRRPADAGCSIEVIQQLSLQFPILGVCLGHQAIGEAFGGQVVQCEPMHGLSSMITHDGTGLFAKCNSPMQVGRYHSLAIQESTLPSELVVTARSEDDVVMGVQHATLPVFGVQFHPESVLSDDGLRVIQNFAEISKCIYPLPTGNVGVSAPVILESIVTSVDARGKVNIAPMGPRVEADPTGETNFVLRPFDSSLTYQNLLQTEAAVIHVTDDVSLFARAAVGTVDPLELVEQFESTPWWPLIDCHRWFAVRVESISEDSPRIDVRCRVIESRVVRPFFGFNRAKHAVIEAAILATRTEFLPPEEIQDQIERLQPLIDKTAGPVEIDAFEFLRHTIDDRLAQR